MPRSVKPPEPPDDKPIGSPHVVTAALGGKDDRVNVTIKVTDRMGDAFVSTEVGFASTMHPTMDHNDAMQLYRRVARCVNAMYNERKAEVRAALGRKNHPQAAR